MKKKHLSNADMDEALFSRVKPGSSTSLEGEAAELQQLFLTMRQNSARTAEWHYAVSVQAAQRDGNRVAHFPAKRKLRWSLAFAALAVSVVTPMEVHHRKDVRAVIAEQREHERIAMEQRTDEALLTNVESDLSSSVPRPLEPLSVKEGSASAVQTKGNNQ